MPRATATWGSGGTANRMARVLTTMQQGLGAWWCLPKQARGDTCWDTGAAWMVGVVG